MFQRRWGVLLIISASLLLDSAMLRQRTWAEEPSPATGESARRVDRFGDPLPAGVRARLGTVRLRHAGVGPAALAFSRDGCSVFSAGGDKGIRQWDVATGKELRRFTENQDPIIVLALSPDGTILAAGGEKGISWWQAKDGKRLGNLEVDHIRSLVFFSDGQTLVSGGEDSTRAVRVWDLATKSERVQVSCPLKSVSQVAFTSNGRYLIAVSPAEKQICLAEAATGAAIRTYQPANWQGQAVAVAPDGQRLAVDLNQWRGGDAYQTSIGLVDLATGRLLRRLLGHEAPLQSLAFSPDGSILASAAYDKTLRLWDVGKGREIRKLDAGELGMQNLVFAPDGQTLAGTQQAFHYYVFAPDERNVAGTSSIRFWEVATGRELLTSLGHQGPITGVAFSPDGKRLATCSLYERVVRLWDSETGQLLHVLSGHEGSLRTVAFLPGGKQLISGSGDSTLRLWDTVTGKELRQFILHEPGSAQKQQVVSMCLSSTGQQVLACSTAVPTSSGEKPPPRQGMIFTAWDVSTGKRLFRRENQQAFGGGLTAIAPDGQTIAMSDEGGGLVLRDAATGKEIQTVKTLNGLGYPLSFSTDGKLFVAHSHRVGRKGNTSFLQEGDLWVYSLVFRKEVIHFPVNDQIRTLAFSPDDKSLALAGTDQRIRLWEVASGQERGSLQSPTGPVRALAFSSDGRYLVSGSDDTTALVWDVAALMGPGPGMAVDTAAQANAYWAQLGDADARKAYRAIWAMVAAPAWSVSLLKDRLQAVAAPDAKQLAQLLAELDDNRFAVRRKASTELQRLGELAEPALRRALADKPSLEVRQRVEQLLEKLRGPVTDLATLRSLRAIEALEHIGNPEANQVLRKLASGAPEARITQEAKASLDRLAKHASPKH